MSVFDTAGLHAAVRTALQESAIPEDHRYAFSVVATPRGVKGVLSARVGKHWHVGSVVTVDPATRAVDGGVIVKATW